MNLLKVMLSVFVLCCSVGATADEQDSLGHKSTTQWRPYVEWTLENSTFTGNPFDIVATVTFTHTPTGETRTTEMFYDGNHLWKFRFTGVKTGQWQFVTISDDSELNDKTGTINVAPNPDPNVHGFITNFGNKWVWQGTDRAFVPQLVMYDHPQAYYNNPDKVDTDIQTFIVEHGFSGFHTVVCCRWFDINEPTSDKIENANPDIRTFEALELLITKVQGAGGMVHIWAWGDEYRRQTPVRWGLNGPEDQRLQRYIAACIGPIPGWSMGYGFDNWEWVTGNDLRQWHGFMHQHFGWKHYLGARADKHKLTQIYEGLDYSSYEQHRPDYDCKPQENYLETIMKRPHKPSFSEDRFRIRLNYRYREKDYTEQMTRRGLYHSTIAGGVANVWGNLTPQPKPGGGSQPYQHPEWVKTYALFFEHRFLKDMQPDNQITNALCLKSPDNTHLIFYREGTVSIEMDLSQMASPQPVVAIDAKKPYREIDLGTLSPGRHTWQGPYVSDWAIAVGTFSKSSR